MSNESDQTESPDYYQRVARKLFILTPFSFVLSWGLSAVQGADTRTCLIVSVAGMLMCLGAAVLFKLRGSKAAGDAVWIKIVLGLIAGLAKRR